MSTMMSTKDYDECEKLYCGTWSLEWEENVDEFLNISGEFALTTAVLILCSNVLWCHLRVVFCILCAD